jgi:hypothetical protein
MSLEEIVFATKPAIKQILIAQWTNYTSQRDETTEEEVEAQCHKFRGYNNPQLFEVLKTNARSLLEKQNNKEITTEEKKNLSHRCIVHILAAMEMLSLRTESHAWARWIQELENSRNGSDHSASDK